MANMSNYLENKLADHLFRSTAYSPAGPYYVALFTTLPSDAGTGGVEVSTTNTNYARVSITKADASWNGTHGTNSGASSGTGGIVSNYADIQFNTPQVASGVNWGTIVGFGIYDASSGGNLLVYGSISPSKNVNVGDPGPKFVAGALQLTFA